MTVNNENIAAVTSSSHVTSARNPITLEGIKREYADLFTGYGKFQGKLHLHTDPSVAPVRMPLRRLPIAIRAKVKAQLDELVRNDIIASHPELGIIPKPTVTILTNFLF